jgi:hypothetical protein
LPVYEITKTEIRKLEVTSFAREDLSERNDLQRLLRQNIDIIAPGTLVIAEEFCQWETSKRRIDLLGVDHAGNLVVIELKRTEDGGHMELQSLRYAAMVSTMTFGQAVDIYTDYLSKLGREENAESELLSHMGLNRSDEVPFGRKVRIFLVSAEFSKEITTSVLWLNEQGLDITCMRLCPYRLEGRVLLDVEQLIPLPEATVYIENVNIKKAEENRLRTRGSADFTKYDLILDGETIAALTKRALVFEAVKFAIARGATPNDIARLVPPYKWLSVEGNVPAEEFWSNTKHLQYSPKKYFCGDGELFRVDGRTYALSNQWTLDTISVVGELARKLPAYEISYTQSPE